MLITFFVTSLHPQIEIKARDGNSGAARFAPLYFENSARNRELKYSLPESSEKL